MSFQLGGCLIIVLLAQAHGDYNSGARDLLVDISWALNSTQNLAVFTTATKDSIWSLREHFQTEVAASAAVVIDRLDTLGVLPSQLLQLQGHVQETSSASDALLAAVHSRLINYGALVARVNDHLISKVSALRHDLAQLIEDTEALILLMDSSLDLLFSRYELLKEIALDLAHFFSGEEVEEIEDLISTTDDLLLSSYTPLSLAKFALEDKYAEVVFVLRSVLSQIYGD